MRADEEKLESVSEDNCTHHTVAVRPVRCSSHGVRSYITAAESWKSDIGNSGQTADAQYSAGEAQTDVQGGEERGVSSEEEGAIVLILRVYFSGDPWNLETDEAGRGIMDLCEELCFPC